MSDSDFISPAQHQQEELLFDSGGTCDCYRLVKDNRVYCVKRPKKDMRSSEAYMNLFRKEFEMGIELEHPNIVRYFAYDEDENGPFIRMDYIDGDSLEAFVAQHPNYFKEKRHRKQFCDELFSALSYLHEKEMLHLDLKPSNILITNKGHHVKLIDLGFGWSESYLHDLGFTRDYCAPEQQAAKTELFGPATDIYALGKILQRFGLASDAVVQRCLKDNPQERYQGIGALQKAIKSNERIRMASKVGFGLAAVLLIGAIVELVGFREAPLPQRPPAPEGAINGLFTINEAGDQVYFSKGNLQYKPFTGIWRFAENQFDYIGGDNANVAQGANHRGWFDLFSWSSNGQEHGAINYQPWSDKGDDLESSVSLYNAYDSDTCDLCDYNGQADWGYNAISNGGNEEGLWRTLTMDEWRYLLDERSTATGMRFAKANVEGVNGLLLLPDDWDNSYQLNDVNNDDINYLSNTIPQPFWKDKVESQGAVFLPAAGIRDGTTVGLLGKYGFYWSATHSGIFDAKGIYFSDSFFNHENTHKKCHSRCVRLVRDAKGGN
jgi:tRNA A-37 threonylcarbamoyl transferase component Bud32